MGLSRVYVRLLTKPPSRVMGAMISVFSGSILAKSFGGNDQVVIFGQAISSSFMGVILALTILLIFEVLIFTLQK